MNNRTETYRHYVAWCQQGIGLSESDIASDEAYDRETLNINSAADGFQRWGNEIAASYKQKRKIHRSTFVTAGALADLLGIERGSITRVLIGLALLNADETLTAKGKKNSRVRDIPEHGTFVLWKAHAIASMIAEKPIETEEDQDHDPRFVDTDVHEFLMSNTELDRVAA